MNPIIEAMKNVDIRTVDINTLVDIRNIKINTELPKTERIIALIRQMGTPYCYRYGGFIVKESYMETENTVDDAWENYLLRINK